MVKTPSLAPVRSEGSGDGHRAWAEADLHREQRLAPGSLLGRDLFALDGEKQRHAGADHGEAREQLAIELKGSPVEIGFNIKYFQEVLSAMVAERAFIELGDALSPAVLREPESDDCLMIVMPMRLD